MAYLKKDGDLLVIIGPSGTGKSSVIRLLQGQGVITVTPSWTTRPPRDDEAKGAIEHHFVKQPEFIKKQKEGYFLESVKMFGLPFWYGLPKIEKPKDGSIPVVMLRSSLLPLLSRHYNNYQVYLIKDDLEKVKERLKDRQASGQKLGSRLKEYEQEITDGQKIANRVFTNSSTLEKLALQIKDAILSDFKS